MNGRAQYIYELFRPQELTGDVPHKKVFGGGQRYLRKLNLPTGEYTIDMEFNGRDKSLFLSFDRDGEMFAKENRPFHDILQGRKDLGVVLQTVTNLLHHLITKEGVQTIEFMGDALDASRVQLYNHFAHLLATRYQGTWKKELGENMYLYTITLRG